MIQNWVSELEACLDRIGARNDAAALRDVIGVVQHHQHHARWAADMDHRLPDVPDICADYAVNPALAGESWDNPVWDQLVYEPVKGG